MIIIHEYLGYFPNEKYNYPLQTYDDEYFYKKEQDILQFSLIDSFWYDPFQFENGQHPQSVSA